MNNVDRKAGTILIGGILTIAIALGISRFVYTPILPAMQQAFSFDDGFAGYLASANYAGYLLGSIWAALTAKFTNRKRRVRWNLVITIICSALMGLVSMPLFWLFFRFLAGFTSAIVFIIVSGLILEELARIDRQAWFGWVYSGVGLGIAISAISIPLLVSYLDWRAGWIGIAAISLLLFIGSSAASTKDPQHPIKNNKIEGKNAVTLNIMPWLVVSYSLVGLGYIVTGTFLVSLVERTFDSITTGAIVWLFVGLAVIPSCPVWTSMGQRFGLLHTLILAQLVQAIGIISPNLISGYFGAVLGAICFGGTFVGIAALTVIIGRQVDPRNANKNIAILTAAFGFGQMVGPTIAGTIAVYKDGFTVPLYGASLTVVLATIFLLTGSVLESRKRSKAF